MNFEFEAAENISDYLEAIKGRDEFVVSVKDGGYTVINYVVMMNDTFPDPATATSAEERRNFILRRDCRGIKFDTKTGKVICKPLHKFFNVNEREETQIKNIDFTKPHVILEKLDGSMICPIPFESETEYGLRYGTKMGVTDVAKPVAEFASTKPEYERFNVFCEAAGVTPIYEWCSRKQRIVIDYPEDTLTLIAMRENYTGKYTKYDALVWYADLYDIPVVKAYEGSVESMSALIEYTKDLKDFEGFVVRFEDGQMCKVKAEDYLRKHKTKEAIQLEKNVIELLVTEKADDVKAFMDQDDLERFEAFERKFWAGVSKTVTDLQTKYAEAVSNGLAADRKRFAVEFCQSQPKLFQRFYFKMLTESNVLGLVKEAIANSCSTQSKIDEVRVLFNCNWNEEK